MLLLAIGCSSISTVHERDSEIVSPSDFASGLGLDIPDSLSKGQAGKSIETESNVLSPMTNYLDDMVLDHKESLFEPTRVGIPITVEALVGQVNGRPIYANAVLEPLSDQLNAAASKMTRSTFYNSLIPPKSTPLKNISSLVLYFEIENMGTYLQGGRMYDLVKNDLLLSEARSGMTKEEEYGLFAIIGQMREDLASAEGGSQSQMRQNIEQQSGVSVEKFLEFQRDQILIEALDRQEIWPKVNVTWRDIQREFEQVSLGEIIQAGDEDETRIDAILLGLQKGIPLGRIDAAQGSITLGMIRLQRDDPRIEEVIRNFELGLTFKEVAGLVDIPNSGEWETFQLGLGGVEDIDVSDVIKSKLVGATVGESLSPIELSSSLVWMSILHQQKPISLYNRRIQIALRNALKRVQFSREKNRFIKSLWGEGSIHEVKAMAERVANIAVRRYQR